MSDSTFPSLEALLEQESRLVLPSLTRTDGVRIGQILLAKALERSLPVLIEVRRTSHTVFRAALDGTGPHNDMYLSGKANVVERFGHSSLYERLQYEEAGSSFSEETSLAFPEYAPFGGGFPLVVAGSGRIGVALVSGLEQQDDHALIVEALDAHLTAIAR